MGYNSINGIIGNIKGKHDSINSVASGALVGLLFKSTGTYSFSEGLVTKFKIILNDLIFSLYPNY